MSNPFREPTVRKVVTLVEEVRSVAGIEASPPLRRAAVAMVLSNPYAGRYEKDLGPLIAWSAGLGKDLGGLAVQALGVPAESYGKGGIADVAGEQEHANALLTTTMAKGLRDAVGGGKAWISSATKVGPPGTAIDIPLAHKDALYVRSHYDAMEVRIPDAPLPDELVAIVVVASGPRLNARVGDLRADEIEGKDGLR